MTTPPGAPESPIRILDDAIGIEYASFLLQDMARSHSAGALHAQVDPASEWYMVAGPGGAIFHSRSLDREVPVRLELWAAAPALPAAPWQVVGDGTLLADSTELKLWSITAAMTPHALVLEAPGPHAIRAALRSEIATDDDPEDAYETDVMEQWLLQLWPGQNKPA